jgi:hypothetical protein
LFFNFFFINKILHNVTNNNVKFPVLLEPLIKPEWVSKNKPVVIKVQSYNEVKGMFVSKVANKNMSLPLHYLL